MSKYPRKIVILGSSGFIGSALRRHFKQSPNFSVEGYSSSELDLRLDTARAKLAKLIDAHTTLIVSVNSRYANTEPSCLTENLEIARNLAAVMKESPFERCVYLSSASVYGDSETDRNIEESTPPAPSNFYGLAKLNAEKLLETTSSSSKILLLILRLCMIYGPGDRSNSYGPPRFMNEALKGNPITLYGDGAELRNYLYIDDLVDIVRQLILGSQTGVYNIASDESYNFMQIALLVQKNLGQKIPILYTERNRLKADKILNVTKLKFELPALRFTSLSDGLNKTVSHLQSHISQKPEAMK